MTKAIYPGSFDPITLGHLDIIRRIHDRFSELVIVVANSHHKNYMFDLEERVALIRENLVGLNNVTIDKCEGLIVDYAQKNNARVIVRGLRAVSDFEHEFAMANMNRKLASDIETMIVFTSPQFGYVASSIVKEVASHGGNLQDLIPQNVIRALQSKKAGGR